MQFDNAKIIFAEYIKQFWGCKNCLKRAKCSLLEAVSGVRNQVLENLQHKDDPKAASLDRHNGQLQFMS